MDSNLQTSEEFPLRTWQLIFYSFISTTGIIGNTLILAVIRRDREMRSTAFGVYISSLAISDFLVTALCIPVYITSTSWFSKHPTGISGDIMCKLVTGYFVLFLFAVISTYTLVALSYERFLAICHVFQSRTTSTPKRAKIVVSLIWALAIIPNLPIIIGQKSSFPSAGSIGAHCTYYLSYLSYEEKLYGKIVFTVVFTIQYLIPITSMVVCFLKIKRALKTKKEMALHSQAVHVQAGELAAIKARQKTVGTVRIMVTAYFSCWSLNQILYCMLNFDYGVPWNGNWMQLSVGLCFLSSCVNPIIYACRSKTFSRGFSEILHCRSSCRVIGSD